MGPSAFYTIFKLEGRDAAACYALMPDLIERKVPPHWMIYVAVDDADAIAAKAAGLGGEVVMQPFDVLESGRMAVIKDPFNAVFSIWQPKTNAGTGITGLEGTACWADLITKGERKAARFYEELFGWSIKAAEHDTSGYLHIQNGPDFIGGLPPAEQNRAGAPPHWRIYFQVDNCEASTNKAQAAGARVLMPPSMIPDVGGMSIIIDPQGAVLALFQPDPRSGDS